jgi:ABC-2 type transport system permease protein
MKANRKSLFFWCLGVIALIGSGMGKYTGMEASGESITELMKEMPKVILAVFGMNGLDLNTAAGYYGVVFFLLLIMTSIHAGILGAGIISKEERDKTSEFLFVKPVSRVRAISFKILAAITNVLILNLVSLAISVVMAKSVAREENLTSLICRMSLAMFIVQLIFLFLGTALASISKNSSKSAGRATTFVLVTYVMSVIIDFSDKLDFLKYFTPFKYFEPKNIVSGDGFEPVFIILSVAVIGILIGATYAFFPRRDLQI